MWQEFNPDGTLTYQDFLETVQIIKPFYILRSLGGLLFIVGAVMMFYNLVKTAKSGKLVENEEAEATVTKDFKLAPVKGEYWHRKIERKPFQMMLFAIVLVSIGGLFQIVPTMIVKSNIPTISSVKPYTPLELEGRDIYIREGCYNCHSQLIRPLRFETARFGEYSKAGEFVYDHPFQWGSKRTGPDLAREGGNIKIKKSNFWHYQHMIRPKDVSKGSIMPAYVWLKDNDLSTDLIAKKINAMRTLGVPYAKGYENQALGDLQKQANEIATDIINNQPAEILKNVNAKAEIKKLEKKEIVALIGYLQRLGKDAMTTTTITNNK
jgi:cytochrome c oxidase cbb3-type subunit I/II